MTTAQKPDALPVVAWLTTWKKDRARGTGSHLSRDEPEWKWEENHYEPLVRLSDAQASLLAKEAECEVLMEALLKIARWELPATGKFWDEEKTRPTSYETEYGSNGARTYMRSLALAAINAARAAADQGGAS